MANTRYRCSSNQNYKLVQVVYKHINRHTLINVGADQSNTEVTEELWNRIKLLIGDYECLEVLEV